MMKWVFPENNGGQESGFHDPGVETFKGNFDRFLARESIQNSIDAAASASTPVRVEFARSVVRKTDVPGAVELLARLEACEKYWRDDPKPKAFFKKAGGLLSSNQVPLLRISDYATTGVTGGDSERKGNWYNLVRCSGSSFKGGGEGGSFGIGKNAPFAASALRTVFYSTLNTDKGQIGRFIRPDERGDSRSAQEERPWHGCSYLRLLGRRELAARHHLFRPRKFLALDSLRPAFGEGGGR